MQLWNQARDRRPARAGGAANALGLAVSLGKLRVRPTGRRRCFGHRPAQLTPSFGSRIVFWRPGTPPPPSARKQLSGLQTYLVIDWYDDPGTAQPVGFTASPCTRVEVRSCTRPFSTTRIATFQQLEPTPQNLAQLTGPGAPQPPINPQH